MEEKTEEQIETKQENVSTLPTEPKKKTGKIVGIMLAAVLLLVGALTPGVILPAVRSAREYQEAEALLDSGKYDEAKAAFEAMEDYRDAETLAQESVYRKASALAEEGQYESAIELWNTLEDYSDSGEQISRAETAILDREYQKAQELMDSGELLTAAEAFDALDGYLDSKAQAADCRAKKQEADYLEAVKTEENGDREGAIPLYRALGDYQDAAERASGCAYALAQEKEAAKLYGEAAGYYEQAGDYADAAEKLPVIAYTAGTVAVKEKDYEAGEKWFALSTGYRDSESKRLKCEYDYVHDHPERTDAVTMKYLKDMKDNKYSAYQTAYDLVYAWHVEIIAMNNSPTSKTHMEMIGQNDKIYVHYKVSGGPPGGVLNMRVVEKLPDCYAGNWTTKVSDGSEGTCSYWYTSGSQTGTTSVIFYDESHRVIGMRSTYLGRSFYRP